MAELVERLMGLNTDGRRKLPVHQFQAIAAEWGRGTMTGAQATAALELSAAEASEAQAIVNTVTSIPITGSATAVADGRARRALRMLEIDQVLLIAERQLPPLDTPAAVRTRLGI